MNSQDIRALQEAYSQVYELDEGAAGDVAARAQKLANQKKGQTPERKKMYQGLADKAAARERGPFQGGDTRTGMTTSDRDTSRESDAYHSSVFGERSKINQHGDSTSGPGGKPKGKKLERQIKRGVSAESFDLYDIILSHLIDEGYADTFEAAEAIMVNMSEDWRESIMEEVLDEGQKKYPTEKVENAGNRKVRTLRDPNISPEKRLRTAIQLDTIGNSFMSHLTNRPQPVPPKRRK